MGNYWAAFDMKETWFIYAIGCLLLGLGAWTIMQPEIMAALYEIKLPSEKAVEVIRAFVGGGELGIGTFLLFHRQFNAAASTCAAFIFCVFGWVVGARVLHAILVSDFAPLLDPETGIECLITVLAFFFWRRKQEHHA